MPTPLAIKNIKASLLLKSNVPPCNVKMQFNTHTLAFRVYATSPQRVNVTGLRSYQELAELVQKLKTGRVFNDIRSTTIDSIFASRKLATPVYFNMDSVYQHARDHALIRHKYNVYYNAEEGSKCLLLPKRTCPPRKKINLKTGHTGQPTDHQIRARKKLPQITLFHTGSVTVMGLKSLSQIDHVHQLIDQLFKDEFRLRQASTGHIDWRAVGPATSKVEPVHRSGSATDCPQPKDLSVSLHQQGKGHLPLLLHGTRTECLQSTL